MADEIVPEVLRDAVPKKPVPEGWEEVALRSGDVQRFQQLATLGQLVGVYEQLLTLVDTVRALAASLGGVGAQARANEAELRFELYQHYSIGYSDQVSVDSKHHRILIKRKDSG